MPPTFSSPDERISSSSAELKLQQPLSGHQRPGAEGRVRLVGREGEIVDPAGCHLDLAVGDQLGRIHQQARPVAVHDAADLRQIVERAEDVRCAAHGHQLDAQPSSALPC